VADSLIGLPFDGYLNSGDALAELSAVRAATREQDATLVAALCRGEEQAYETLIDRFQQPVYNLIYRLMDDSSEASDVVQEVFLKVFRHVDSFRGQSSLKTWVYRIAVNEAHNHRRWFSRHRRREVGLEREDADGGLVTHEFVADPGRSPFDQVSDRETRDCIEAMIGNLNPAFRTAVVLRDLEDMSYDEIADVLQISLGTVKSRILRGREALRKQLTADSAVSVGWRPEPATE
jgi:RNA polymerase sigma-70 factor (ECF subfamily)